MQARRCSRQASSSLLVAGSQGFLPSLPSHTRGRGRAYAAGLYFSHPEGAETPAQGEPLHVLWWEGPLHFYLSSERADSPVAQEIEVSQTASSPHRLQPLLRAGLLRVLKSEPP